VLEFPGFRGEWVSTESWELHLSCLSLSTSGIRATETLYWNGGTTLSSTWENTNYVQLVNGVLVSTLTGPITSGTLAGATLTLITTLLPSELTACTEPGGLQEISGLSTWIFTGL
jgi:hypothetical protein